MPDCCRSQHVTSYSGGRVRGVRHRVKYLPLYPPPHAAVNCKRQRSGISAEEHVQTAENAAAAAAAALMEAPGRFFYFSRSKHAHKPFFRKKKCFSPWDCGRDPSRQTIVTNANALRKPQNPNTYRLSGGIELWLWDAPRREAFSTRRRRVNRSCRARRASSSRTRLAARPTSPSSFPSCDPCEIRLRRRRPNPPSRPFARARTVPVRARSRRSAYFERE